MISALFGMGCATSETMPSAAPEPSSAPAEPKVFKYDEDLPESIALTVNGHKDLANDCYDNLAIKNPAAVKNKKVQVKVGFAYNGEGTVVRSYIINSNSPLPELEECVLNVVNHMQFPHVRDNGVVEVKYTFLFQSGNR
jgi:hypothetical protein